ncbi:hypothetical protein DHEL01_v209775 [Diaporthe helianthi]|uniref:Uncharacterized protein n=1 Tax=Diaporthe helianthi TaxID=158607 RepID=A0A2P5HNK0_DIAHE|nr:hypothetical protein DHEL01_v209775 [Diaporthe helianthi]
MFKRFRRSFRISSAGSRSLAVPAPVCHEYGHSARNTVSSSYAGSATTGPYDSDHAGMRNPWNSSTSSDSGYGGGSRLSELDAHMQQLDLSDDRPALDHPALTILLPLPLRRPTYNSSIYSETSTYEQPTRQEIIVEEPAHADGLPVYDDDDFDLPPRTFTNYSDQWKPKSRYSRLNELPAASPTAMAFPRDDMDEVESSAEKEPSSPEKNLKRRSMVLRPTTLKRLASIRTKGH